MVIALILLKNLKSLVVYFKASTVIDEVFDRRWQFRKTKIIVNVIQLAIFAG
jgi:hypothetical protein